MVFTTFHDGDEADNQVMPGHREWGEAHGSNRGIARAHAFGSSNMPHKSIRRVLSSQQYT
ncbi:MAG TPA: hypothetical protein VGL77_00200 [Armatimonadota bacterium]|jgi:hypothetical protein